MDNLPNLAQAYRMVLQEQRHKEISKAPHSTESVAFAIDIGQNNFRASNSNFQKFNKNPSGRFYSNGPSGFQ